MGIRSKVSGIVLAGGMSRRLGRNKAIEPVGGEPLITRVIDRLSKVTDDTVVVANDLERASLLAMPESAHVVLDIYPGKGSLGGIFTGLSSADAEWGLVVACDMPFLNAKLFAHILSVRNGYDAVLPVLEGRPEPTHAAYSKSCLPHMRRRLEADDLKIAHFFDDVRVKFIEEQEIDLLDPEHLSFFNVNTQEDLDRSAALIADGH